MRSTLNILLILLFLSVSSCAHKRPTSEKYLKLEKTLDIISKHKKAMGKLLILEKGEVAFEKEFGFKRIPRDPIFRVGSISKTYMAVIISRLVEDGVLKFEDKVSKFYPQVPNAKLMTVEHLLRHRSGLVNFTSLKDYLSYAEKFSSEEDHLKRMIKNGVEFKPGKKKKYSNTGYVLLSFIAQKASGKSFSDLLAKYISKPLGLTDTFVFDSQNPRSREVISYEKVFKWRPSTNTHESIPLGAGAVASTAKELGEFLYALFNGKIVKSENLKRMSLMVDNYGHGLFTVPYVKKTGIGHTGGIDGFLSIATYFKDSDTVFVQLLNAAAMSTNNISIAMLASYYKDPFDLPVFKEAVKVPVEVLKKYKGTFKAPYFPLEIKVYIKDGTLNAQAQGQQSIPLEAFSHKEFSFSPAQIKINFDDSGNSFELIQGKKFKFKRLNK